MDPLNGDMFSGSCRASSAGWVGGRTRRLELQTVINTTIWCYVLYIYVPIGLFAKSFISF